MSSLCPELGFKLQWTKFGRLIILIYFLFVESGTILNHFNLKPTCFFCNLKTRLGLAVAFNLSSSRD
jgi:hypothetical protein